MTYAEKIAAQSGLVRTHTMVSSDTTGSWGDDICFFTNASQTNPVGAALDASILASGQNSLKFTIPSQSSSGASGQWTMRFASDNSVQFGAGETFYVQWMQKFDRYFFEHVYQDGGGGTGAGWKQAIIGEADSPGCSSSNTTGVCATSCTQLEVVPQNTNLRGFPSMYNSCPNGGLLQNFELGPINGSDFDLQPHQGLTPSPGTYCSYQALPGTTNCFTYAQGLANSGDQVTQWGTYTVRIQIGTLSSQRFQNSNVKMWVSWGGAAADLVFDWDVNLIANGDFANKYGRLWLLPYHSGKSDTEITSVSYTWYANPIIATSAIPLTTDEVALASTLAVVLR